MEMNPAARYLEDSKYQNLERSKQQAGEPQPPLHVTLREGPRISLPSLQASTLGGSPLREMIETRRSLRSYVETALTVEALSYLLWCTQGMKPESTEKYTLRTVPSAGARHAFETLLLIHRVDGLAPGLYQYDAAHHELIHWDAMGDPTEAFMAACHNQPFIGTSAVTFVWVAIWERMAWRYGERSLRYLHLDAGHICQNLHLSAESIGAGACAVGAFDDDQLNGLLGLDGVERFVTYLAGVGKREA